MDATKPLFIYDKAEAERLERIAYILKSVRLGVIKLLEITPKMSVTDINDVLGIEQSLLSHHLQNMKLKGLLSSKKDGRKVMYSLKERDISLIMDCLDNCQCNM